MQSLGGSDRVGLCLGHPKVVKPAIAQPQFSSNFLAAAASA